MDLPKTWGELGVWLLVQFPVLGTALLAVWLAYRVIRRLHDAQMTDLKKAHEDLVRAKDAEIVRLDRLTRDLTREVQKIRKAIEEM